MINLKKLSFIFAIIATTCLLNCTKKVIASDTTISSPSVNRKTESVKSQDAIMLRHKSDSITVEYKKTAKVNREELMKKISELQTKKACLKQSQMSATDEIEKKPAEIDNELQKLEKDHSVEKTKEDESPKGKKFALDDAEVIGYLDNPTPVYLIDSDKKEVSPGVHKVRGESALSVMAGFHDDNEEFAYYRDFCDSNPDLKIPYKWDISERYVIRVSCMDSSPVFNANVILKNQNGEQVFTAKTQAGGEIMLFPKMDLGEKYTKIGDYTISVENGKPETIGKGVEDRITYQLKEQRRFPSKLSLQICFLIDATGSMSDEIEQLQDVLFSIHSRILKLPSKPQVSFSVVAYRDKGDNFLVKGHPFTTNIDSFQIALDSIKAGGGGDNPEDVEAGLNYCLDSLHWTDESMKFVFLIGDAAPHLNKKEKNYLYAARKFRENGIKVCPIGASGLKIDGEFVFRQIAVITNGEFVFLNYGEKGESEGAGTEEDPGKVSHHTGSNYNSRRLDDIVFDIISREVGYVTPPRLIVNSCPDPLREADILDSRVVNLLRQVFRGDDSTKGKTLAVSPVIVSDTSLSQLSEYIWGAVLEKVPSLTRCTVVERDRLEEVFHEQALFLAGATAQPDEKSVGNLLNANYLLMSNLQYLGNIRVCHMRLVDCSTGTVLSAARIKL